MHTANNSLSALAGCVDLLHRKADRIPDQVVPSRLPAIPLVFSETTITVTTTTTKSITITLRRSSKPGPVSRRIRRSPRRRLSSSHTCTGKSPRQFAEPVGVGVGVGHTEGCPAVWCWKHRRLHLEGAAAAREKKGCLHHHPAGAAGDSRAYSPTSEGRGDFHGTASLPSENKRCRALYSSSAQQQQYAAAAAQQQQRSVIHPHCQQLTVP